MKRTEIRPPPAPWTSTVPALVFGYGVTALGVVRILHDAGIRAYVIGTKNGIVTESRWFEAAPPSDNGVTPEADLGAYLEGLPIPRAVLIPCVDSWALKIAALSGPITDRFPSVLPARAVLESLIDKSRLAQLAAAVSVPHPRTMRLDQPADLAAIPEHALQTGFFKPCDSELFFRRFNTKAFWEKSWEKAIRRWREARDAGLALLFQEYIPGPPDHHYFLDGFVDRSGHVSALFARRRLRMYPPNFGNSTSMVSVPIEETGNAPEELRRLLDRAGFRGIFSAEFKRDPRDNRLKLLEVNVRAWWYVDFAARSGVDVVMMAYRDALGLPAAPVKPYRIGARCVYPYYDYCAYRELRRSGQVTFGAWLASLVGASQPLFRWDDPEPAWTELYRVLFGALRNAAARQARESTLVAGWRTLLAMLRPRADRATG